MTQPTGYGLDVWCMRGYRAGRIVTGAAVVAQALYRRFTTVRGTLRDGAEGLTYGYDLASFVGRVGTRAASAALPGIVRAEALKDDRLQDVRVAATSATDSAGNVYITVTITATCADPANVFDLTLGVSSARTELISFREAA
jgi:hypothetical protein